MTFRTYERKEQAAKRTGRILQELYERRRSMQLLIEVYTKELEDIWKAPIISEDLAKAGILSSSEGNSTT